MDPDLRRAVRRRAHFRCDTADFLKRMPLSRRSRLSILLLVNTVD